MREAIIEYVTYLKSQGKSKSRRYQSEHAMIMLAKWIEEYREVEEWRAVTEKHLRAFLVYLHSEYVTLKKQQLKASSIKTWWNCIYGFFAWQLKQGRMIYNPAEAIEVPKAVMSLPKIPNEIEMMRLIEMPDTSTEIGLRDRALMEVLYATGIRHVEAYRMNMFDADTRNRCLIVREGKGGRDRMIPLTENSCYWITRYICESRPVLASGALFKKAGNKFAGNTAMWLSVTGRRFPYETIGAIVRKYAKAAEIKANVHTFRHCYATHLLRNGANIRYVQKLLGHDSIDTTMIYTHLNIEDLKTAVAKLEEA